MVNRSTNLYTPSRHLRPQREVHLETMKYIFIYLLLTLKIFGQEYSIQVLGFHICDVNQNITNSKRIDFSTQNRGLFDFFWPAKNNYSTEFDSQDYSIKKWNKTVNQGSYKKSLSAFLESDKTMIYSNKLFDDIDDASKQSWYDFLKEIRQFAKKRMLNFRSHYINQL